jgi:hypothetical protein
MAELLELIKSVAKEGADFTEIEKTIGTLNPLTGLSTKEEAWDFVVKEKGLLLSAFDMKQTERAETIETNLRKGKIADEWKERETALRKELNPEETPEQKTLREMSEKIASMESDKSTTSLKSELSKKAQELEFDPIKAQDYAVYGDQAMDKLEADATWFKEQLESRLSAEMKKQFPGGPPPQRKPIPPVDIDKRIMEARAAGKGDLAMKLMLEKNRQA